MALCAVSMASFHEMSAFCSTCPSLEAVTHLFAHFGLELTYSRPAEMVQEYLHLPLLPVQYHYEDDWGTQVLFLAGSNHPNLASDDDREESAGSKSYSPYASRFWLIAGAQASVTRRVQEALTKEWRLCWHDPQMTNAEKNAA